MTVEYLLSDHPSTSSGHRLNSTSLTTDGNGAKVLELRYCVAPPKRSGGGKAWGEVRATWTNTPANIGSAYKSPAYTYRAAPPKWSGGGTGQYSYMDDPTTSGVTEGFGLMFYNARWYDPALGRFAQADTMIPQEQGTQAWDRFAYVSNNPIKYNDPTGHTIVSGDGNTCFGDNCTVTHTILVGTSPVQPPLGEPASYGELAEGSYCGPKCSLKTDPPGIAGAAPVIADAGNGWLLNNAQHGKPAMFTFLTYEEHPNGAITATSLTMINHAGFDINVKDVTFVSEYNNATSEKTAYSVNRYWISSEVQEGGYGVGTIEANSIGSIPLVPSGNSQNPTNTWASNQSVTVVVTTGWVGSTITYYPDRATIR